MLDLFDCSNVSVTFTQTFQSGGCENPGDIVRIYTATDDCGKTSTFEQFISVVDNEGPEVEAPDHTVDCGAYVSDDLYPIRPDCALNDWTLNEETGLAEVVKIQSGVLPTMAQPNLWKSLGVIQKFKPSVKVLLATK